VSLAGGAGGVQCHRRSRADKTAPPTTPSRIRLSCRRSAWGRPELGRLCVKTACIRAPRVRTAWTWAALREDGLHKGAPREDGLNLGGSAW